MAREPRQIRGPTKICLSVATGTAEELVAVVQAAASTMVPNAKARGVHGKAAKDS